MENPAGALRYAIRQFAAAPIFTAAAVLTLALGIGGTTAIFTLIHAVMLRSLPVTDPATLYRIGDGDNCCVQGGPQDEWGMFSYPLFERLQHQGVQRAEDRRIDADAEPEGQDRGGGEDRREPKLAEGIADGADRILHVLSLDGTRIPGVVRLDGIIRVSR